jgi:hypothetical protein
MDAIELRERLGEILREEARKEVDWATVERMCEKLDQDLAAQRGFECPHFVFHYLSDPDIRAKDDDYGGKQRAEVRRYVETGEYADSTEISPWGCLGVIIAVGALLFFLLSCRLMPALG